MEDLSESSQVFKCTLFSFPQILQNGNVDSHRLTERSYLVLNEAMVWLLKRNSLFSAQMMIPC